MSKMRIAHILGSAIAIFGVLPGAKLAADELRAYELIWLIPFVPAFIVTFFWIVVVMIGHYVQANPYKDERSIRQSKAFLVFFNWLFLAISALFGVTGTTCNY